MIVNRIITLGKRKSYGYNDYVWILGDQIGSGDFKLAGDGGLAEAAGRGGIL
jgi:hypothetical protein